MRNKVTFKIVYRAALAVVLLAVALLTIEWINKWNHAQELVDDSVYQVTRSLQSLNTHGEYAAPRMLAAVAASVPPGVRVTEISLETPTGPRRATLTADPANDGAITSSPVGLLSPIPPVRRVNTLTAWPTKDGKLLAYPASAVVNFTSRKVADGNDLILQLEIAFFGLLVCVAIIWATVYRTVIQPTAAIIRIASRIANGDTDLRLAVTSNDEFGKIMRAFNDMTDALLTTQQQADMDGLTQLFNHRYLQEKIAESIVQAQRSQRHMAIILIDLNKFKLLNDTFGHLVGDRFLVQTAAVLRRAVHLDGLVGRYGGDEFVIVMPHATRERAMAMAARIRRLMRLEQFRPHPISEPIPITFSMGVAVYPSDGASSQELIAFADASLYSEKDGAPHLMTVTREIETAYAKVPHSDITLADGGLFRTLFSLVVAVDHKDQYTQRHSEHVAEWSTRFGKALGLPEDTCNALRVAGLLHDVGKIGIPDSILRKPTELSDHEYDIIKGHVELSERLIQGVPYEELVLQAVSTHHEHWDGTGYPRGLKGNDIPAIGRIMMLVDCFSALSLDRPYRRALPFDEIRDFIINGSGRLFDPALVDPFVAIMEESVPELTLIDGGPIEPIADDKRDEDSLPKAALAT
ncbi:MAG TPA: diguanylate cyclase [Capsulimonadaceae bacterium]|jgi:diguanylate cyclase (GGDEF)-like protein